MPTQSPRPFSFLDGALRPLLRSSAFRAAFWAPFYSAVHRVLRGRPVVFMNYGYLPPAERPSSNEVLPLLEQLSARLYRETLPPEAARGSDVLEVGCGRGGGAARRVTGLDYSGAAIAFARKAHGAIPNLDFREGSASALPFADSVFDRVVSVESSHCYPSIDAFLAEAARVLRPGGTLHLADLREAVALPDLRERFGKSAFRVEEEIDLTPGVLHALRVSSRFKTEWIEAHVPRVLRGWMGNFAATQDSAMYREFTSGRLLYFRWVLVKKN